MFAGDASPRLTARIHLRGGTMSRPRPVVLSGPSGAGKSTLLKRLMKEHEGVFGFSVSRTCVCVWAPPPWV